MKHYQGVWRGLCLFLLLAGMVFSSRANQQENSAQASASENQGFSALEVTFPYHNYLPIIFRNANLPPFFGLEAHSSFTNATTMDRTTQSGVDLVRMGLRVRWSELQPVQGGAIQWEVLADFENELRTLKAAGVTPAVVIYSSPLWAVVTNLDDPTSVDEDGDYIGDGKSYCGAIATDYFDDFAAFMVQLVRRYGTEEFGVKIWEIGNELDVDPHLVPANSDYGCWGDWNEYYYGGQHYGQMLAAVTPAIRAADPFAKVWVGGLLLGAPEKNDPYGIGNSHLFLEGIILGGGAPYFDAVPYHWYAWYDSCDTYPNCKKVDLDIFGNTDWQDWGGGTYGKAAFLKQIMDRYGVNKPLVLNECALGCNPNWSEGCAPELSDGFLQAQADFVIRSAMRARKANVSQYYWFTLEENAWGYVGLLDYSRQPKPVYLAYQILNAQLAKSAYLGTVNYGTGTEGYAFDRGTARVHVVWAAVDEIIQISIPGDKLVAIYDRDGASIALPALGSDGNYHPSVEFSARYFILKP